MAEARSAGPAGAGSTTGEGLVDKIRKGASQQLNDRKNQATDGIGTVVDAVRHSTQQLRDQNQETIARYVEQTADQIERLAQRLRDKDVTQIVNDLQHLSRRHPTLFVGGAFAVGLIGARFFKSSARDAQPDVYRNAAPGRGGTSISSASEPRGYATGAGASSYGSHDVSRVHDYATAATLGSDRDAAVASGPMAGGAAGGDAGEETPSPGASRSARARRSTQIERT